ncbi:MAG: hypothetical protein A2X59_13090 [Nitrospirae bacterium GWC2_42_7]|nr:MAG: hypothetical protein A2X59_13090 [Nitrospirae bacterium GWC2_42_7]
MDKLAEGLTWYFAFIFSIVMHEASHAYTAMRLGDNTAYNEGHVTLNPLPHIKREYIGTIVVPIFSFLASGWMIGWASVPYDRDWARRHPDRSAWMSLSGPAANLVIVLVCAALIRIGMAFDIFFPPETLNFSHIIEAVNPGVFSSVATFISIMFSLNLVLFFFNLLPVPPLDGSGVVPLLLGKDKAVSYLDFIENTQFMFFGLLIAWKVFDYVFDPIHLACINLLYPGFGYH